MRSVTVTKSFTFEAAHVLPWHSGKCSRLHGHTYRLDVSVSGALDQNGVVVDFGELGDTVRTHVLAVLDHQLLNDIVPNPTAELVAIHILDLLASAGVAPTELTLWETPTARVTLRA